MFGVEAKIRGDDSHGTNTGTGYETYFSDIGMRNRSAISLAYNLCFKTSSDLTGLDK